MRALDADPAATPALEVRLTLSVRGVVDTIDVAAMSSSRTRLDDTIATDLTRCVRGALAHYSFPRANEVGRTTIHYRVELAGKTPAGPR